ncbi:M24 family metallopeptidase [Paenibacillus alginolyticus]|uniref:Xaa-Pro peptidase family protein n=1 Tax=Paenibacillus alginolyticus TaxID=59839 RepID=A0ABT4G5M7_9BACL|nr:Xaa-Pro peptidase family protein [Paenibacillus alginolyticus]MCY9691455.1 Xaa-Pro peptidase family protein [Paenibacillus alginolyticus]MEC0146563.1 Xaa-Pro peptidase family protein [Paenibacillus alginolyticus]
MTIFQQRQQALQREMIERGWSGFLVTNNVDIYYYCGSMQTGYLFIPAEGDALYLVRRSLVRAEEEASAAVEALGSLKTLGERLRARCAGGCGSAASPLRIATELDVLPVQLYLRLQAALPGAVWEDGSLLVREQRMIKSPDEVVAIREAARVVDAALEAVIPHIREGMAEFELMALIEHQLRLRGHQGLMRMRAYNSELITGMVAAGAAAAVPTYFDGPAGGTGLHPSSPQSSGRALIGRGEPILVDIGCTIDGYLIDQTRTLVIGDLDPELQRAYDVAEQVLRATEARLQPGVIAEHLYLLALDQVQEAGLSAHFMGYGADQVKFLGHGIGLEIDELPVLAKGFKYPLAPGMVIAIEPKFTFPGRGVVGIEDTYLITENGYEKLTISRDGILRV